MKRAIAVMTLAVCVILSVAAAGGVKSAKAEEQDTDPFYISPITDEIFARIQGKSFKDDCTLPREDLRYLHVLHTDLD